MTSAKLIVNKFGTQNSLASAIGVRQSNISYWVRAGSIPQKWHAKIIEAAGSLGIQISVNDFFDAPELEAEPVLLPPKDPNLRVLNSGVLDIAGYKVRCAVLNNGKRVVFQREIVGLLTGNLKGGLSRYFAAKSLQPFVPAKFKGPLEDAVFVFPYNRSMAQGFEGIDLIDICDMYLKARQARDENGRSILQSSQQKLAAQAEIITRAFAKVGITAAIDEATGFQKQKDEYQKLLSKYIAEDLQPWIKTFGDNFYFQIYRLKGWDWSRHITDKKNHPWEAAKITNRIIYEKLPDGVLDKLRELSPRTAKGHRTHKLFRHLSPNAGYVHLVKHMGHTEAIMERHADGDWQKALHEIDTRFPSLRDPYGQLRLLL
jgi:hypothetical protein